MFLSTSLSLGQAGPTYEELIEDARRAASKGNEFSLRIPGKDAAAHVYYNKPKPFCFAYSIPGEWLYGEGPGSWRSRDGQQLVGILPYEAREFRRYKGQTVVERAAASFVKDYERQLKARVEGATLMPHESAQLRIWKWSAPPVNHKGREVHLATKYIVEVGSEGLLILTAIGKDKDELALRILYSVRISTTAPCFLPEVEKLLATLSGNQGKPPTQR